MADFPHELFRTPEPWIHNKFTDIVQFTEMPRGGHFAAFEEPELFAADVIQFVAKVEKRLLEKTAEERQETTGWGGCMKLKDYICRIFVVVKNYN